MATRTPEECDCLFAEHVNAGSLEALLALYEPECALVKSDGTVATGHAAIREVMARLIAMRQPEAGQARAGGSEYLDPLLPVRRVTDDEQALRVDVEPERLKDAARLSADLHDRPRRPHLAIDGHERVPAPVEHDQVTGVCV